MRDHLAKTIGDNNSQNILLTKLHSINSSITSVWCIFV